MIERPQPLAWLTRWARKDVVKVITGMRRCGKSTVLALFRDRLRNEGVDDAHILSINFESLDEEYPLEPRELYRFVRERLASGMNYVFFDEVQHVHDFQIVVDALAVRDDVDLYITGSNAYFLSGELATLLTGRYVEYQLLPLSFAEYRSAFDASHPTDRLFGRYLTYGGMPYVARLDNEQSIADYLGGVFNTVLVHDIGTRHPRIDMRKFLATASFLADTVGSPVSLNRLSSGLAQAGRKVGVDAVGEYVDALLENYLLFRAQRYDVKGRAYLSSPDKYYLGDTGLRFWLLGKTAGDDGHRLENAVYLELLRRARRVDVGRDGASEIDFVASHEGGRAYYQVSQTVLAPETLKRELAPLQAVQDAYPKILLTMDTVGLGDSDGIQVRNVIDWLLEQPSAGEGSRL